MTATATVKVKEEPYKKNGIWNYPELKSGMRLAVPSDFAILTDELVFGINVLYLPAPNKHYQAHSVADAESWMPHIIAGKVYVDKLPYKQCGLYYYPHMPLGCRKAVFSDFLTVDHEIIPGVDFLVLGTGCPELEAHRSTDVEHIVKWIDWIAAGRVYVKAN